MTERLHIAHFTNTYLPVISGVVRSVSAFREALTALNHNVFVFAQGADDFIDTEPFIFRYPTLPLHLPGDFPATLPFSPFIDMLLPLLKVNVVHSHHPFLLGQTAAHKAAELNVPLIFTYHTRYREYSHYIALSQQLVKKTIYRWMASYMRQCHHIIAPSQTTRQRLAAEYGVHDQITVIPTGLTLEVYATANGAAVRQQRGWQNDQVLISTGRLAKEKNWPTLLEAAARVIQQRAGVRLVIIGEGEERTALQELSQTLGVADRIEFVGALPFHQVPAYLKAADLFCFASLTETQGLVTMEAMAAGLPTVAVDADGTRDILVHGQSGLLTENNSEALAQAIDQVLGNEALLQHLRAGADAAAPTFDIHHQARHLVEVYRQAIEDHRAQRFVTVEGEGIERARD